MRAPTSFFLVSLFCFIVIFYSYMCITKHFFGHQNGKKKQQVCMQIQLWINVQSWNQSLIHWQGSSSAKFIVVLYQCKMNSKEYSSFWWQKAKLKCISDTKNDRSKLVCEVRDTAERCSLIPIFTLILKLMVQIASRISVKSFYCQNLL